MLLVTSGRQQIQVSDPNCFPSKKTRQEKEWILQSWHHLWDFLLLKPTCADCCGCYWCKTQYVFERPPLQWLYCCIHPPIHMVFYLTSLLIGIGAAMLWTAQGQFLVENSEASTINRNTGMFWALLQCSMIFGNLYIYFEWNGATDISDNSRRNVFLSLLVASVLGTLSFLILRQSHPDEEMLSDEEGQSLLTTRMRYKHRANSAMQDAKAEFKTIFQLLKTKTIVLLSPCMAYSGLELSFYSGVYGTCIGATTHFGGAAKGLIGISGIVIGAGEIVGGGLFGLLCKNNRFRRTSVVFLGMVVHFVAFYLIFLNIPADAPVVFKTTTQMSPYLSPSVSIALLCSSCLDSETSTPAFAIFKFIQSVFAAVAFFYSGHLLLMWQLLVMVVLGFSGTCASLWWNGCRTSLQTYRSINRKHRLVIGQLNTADDVFVL
ncbi:hypothetical protein WMY93_003855 [Mugilogobius chulae]|uniref:UNC93-like protein MFSD11 n=1 Tax=Mugilogobius chulae TaxID=88201 RepID=A0AAW0Q8N2_9GOBI